MFCMMTLKAVAEAKFQQYTEQQTWKKLATSYRTALKSNIMQMDKFQPFMVFKRMLSSAFSLRTIFIPLKINVLAKQ